MSGLLAVLKDTNWIIAGNSPKCNNMIYFNTFNLKSDCAIKYITHFCFYNVVDTIWKLSFYTMEFDF